MRSIIRILILSCSTLILHAQLPQLDVEGHAKIRGNIDINHMDDTTSVFIGRNAGVNTDFTDIRYNAFVGSNAGYYNSTGHNNSFFGNKAGINNIGGHSNSFFGSNAGYSNSSGVANSFFGRNAGGYNSSGDWNSFFGILTGINNTSGDYNSFFGSNAGNNHTSGTRNTFIGYLADQVTYGDSLDRAIAIGYQAKVNCSNCAVIGGTGLDSVNVGIGIDSPQYKLHVLSPNTIGVYGRSTNNIGIYGNSDYSIGVVGNSDDSIGVYGSSDILIGVFGISGGTGVKGHGYNIGVYGESDSIGVYGLGDSIGVYGDGGTFDFWAHNGNYGNTSSKRWKSNIKNISEPLTKISNLRGVSFDWDERHGGKHTVGFIAEEVGKVLPEIVQYEENGIDAKGMDYNKITPLVVEAINALRREYQKKFEGQQTEIDQLKQEIASLRNLIADQ